MYKIKIKYRTGSSFSSEIRKIYLDIEFESLELAKLNMQFIKEHYEMHQDLENRSSKLTHEEYYIKNKDKEWFVYEPNLFNVTINSVIDESKRERYKNDELIYVLDKYFMENCIKLKLDNGKYYQLGCFWIGYFESLISVKIKNDKENLKINF